MVIGVQKGTVHCSTVLALAWLLAQGAAPVPAPADAAAAAPAAPAKQMGPAPSLSEWLGEAHGITGAFPHNLAFVSALPENGAPKFLNIDAEAFNKLGYFQVANQATAAWDYKLNKAAFADEASGPLALELTKADTLVLAPEKGDWKLLRFKDSKRVVIATAKAPKSTKPADLMAWLPEALGWDGVVLARRGDYLLVGSTKALLAQPEIQALAVSSSDRKLTLKAAERQGSGLLSLRETAGGVAIFDIVFLGRGVKDLPVGTKLVLEKKKS